MPGEGGAEFAELYEPLRRFAAVVGDPDLDADDLVHDALVRTLAMHHLDELDDPAAYLRTVILRLATSDRRTAPEGNPALVPDPDLAALWRLEPVDRAAVFLAVVERRSDREIADALVCTEEVARQCVSRAPAGLPAERLDGLSRAGVPRGADAIWEAANQRLRRRRLIRIGAVAGTVALLAVVVVLVAGRDDTPAIDAGSDPTQPSVTQTIASTPSGLEFDVPWVDRPYQPADSTTTVPEEGERPCTALDVTSSLEGPADPNPEPPGTSRAYVVTFENVGPTSCRLGGVPTSVVARAEGLPSIVGYDGEGGTTSPANIPPGESGALEIFTNNCDPNGVATQPPRPKYELIVTMPGGGDEVVSDAFDPECRIATGAFGIRFEEPPDPPWAGELMTTITAPPTIRAGTTLAYVVTFANLTDRAVGLDPCPTYATEVRGTNVNVQRLDELNCDRVQEVPAAGRVTYEMRAPIPGDATGDLTITWQVSDAPDTPGDQARVRVVLG